MLDNKYQMHIRDTVRLSACRVIPQTRQQKRVKILVVNGHGRGGKLLQDILISGGYQVEALSDGREGLELCKRVNLTVSSINRLASIRCLHSSKSLPAKSSKPLCDVSSTEDALLPADAEKGGICKRGHHFFLALSTLINTFPAATSLRAVTPF